MPRFAPLSTRELPAAFTKVLRLQLFATRSFIGSQIALVVLLATLLSAAMSTAQILTISADDQSVASGAAMPALTYTLTPSVQLQTTPTCVSSANSASAPGLYMNAITCVGAAATGYTIVYVPGALTVGSSSGTSATLPDSFVGIPYSQQLRIPGHSTSTTTWAIPAAPSWVSFNTNGTLSGTPTTAGSYTIGASWTDGTSSGIVNVTLKVQPGFGDLVLSEAGASSITKVNRSTYAVDRTVDSTLSSGFSVAVDQNTGDIYAARQGSTGILRLTTAGQIIPFNTSLSFSGAVAIAVDQNGFVFVADTSLNGVYKMNSSGQVVDASGNVQNTNPPSAFAALPSTQNNQDVSMVFDRDGNLIVASDGNGLEIDRVTPAGNKTQLYTAANVQISAIDILRDGSVGYIVALKNSNTLWRITDPGTPSVATTPFTSNALINNMTGIAAVPGDLFSGYFASESNNNPLLKVVPATGSVTNVVNLGNATSMTWFRYGISQISILATNPLPAATTGTQYSFQFTASGGDGDYTWTAESLPPGLAISSSGLLSGTPTTNGTYSSIEVHVTDGHGTVGNGEYSLTVGGGTTQSLTITANNQTATYGGPLPTFTYTVTPTVTLTTSPTCTTTGSTAAAGVYPITCSGASLAGYTINYSPGTLTVNPAVLTVTANNISADYNTAIPPLTYSFSGFVNNDTAAVFNGYAPSLSTAAIAGSPVGTYPILITQGTLPSVNYTFLFVNGTLTINPVPQTPTLSFMGNYFVTGDYIARSVSSTSGTVGSIVIPDSTAASDGIPAGADILDAFLYWQAIENSATPPNTNAQFRGYAVTGDQVGSDIDPTKSFCFTGVTGLTVRTYRANVMQYMPMTNGAFQGAGTYSVSVLQNAYGASTPNATLVIIYRLLGGTTPLRATVIYDGNWSMEYPPGYTQTLNQTLKGFYDSAASGSAKFSDVTGLLQNSQNSISLLAAQSNTSSLTLPDDSSSFTMPNNHQPLTAGQCMIWGATVFSTTVKNSDGDGLLDAWKTGPPQGDPKAGNPGYYDVSDGTWIGLPGAAHGQRDLFVQLDYMVGTDGHSHQPLPDAITQVQTAFLNKGVHLHIVPGYSITEDTCTDDTSVNPPLLCVFPNEPGVVIWKTGLEVIKSWPINPTNCLNGGDCTARFPVGKKDSYHYVLFGHSVGTSTWSIQAKTLTGITVNNNVATITLAAPTTCPTRITIDGVLSTPTLNGVYNVSSCPTANTITVATPAVASGTFPGALPEPLLNVAIGTTDSTSGFSDIGGGDTTVTLGKWGTQALRVNVQSGTLMHELGHTLSLTHGGRYFPNQNYVSTTEPNCKTNYQSVMNYFFQVDLLGSNGVLDFSSQSLTQLDESALNSSSNPLANATYSTTKWYSPQPPYMVGTTASYHCDGTPVGPSESPLYLIEGLANPITWNSVQDLNFDGGDTKLNGYNDWAAVDLRQLGAGGADYTDAISGLKLSGGGGLKLSGGGGLKLSGGGGLKLSGGGGLKLSGGGGLKLSGGGGLKLSGGGGITEQNFAVADSYVRPPRNVRTASSTSGNLVSWTAPLFGNIASFTVFRIQNSGPLVSIASVPFVAGQTAYSYLDPASNLVAGATYSYTVGTVLVDGRSSTVANPPTAPAPQTINFAPLPNVYFGAPDFTVSATATSGLPVSFALQSGSTGCSLSGTTVHLTGTGTCSITASQAGDAFALPATPVTRSFSIQAWTIQGFYKPVSMSTSSTLVWNDVKAGSTVPLKFNVLIGTVQQTSTSVVKGQTVSIYSVACPSTSVDTTLTLTTASGTALRYDSSSGQFIQNWQTPKTTGCYTATVTTLDGSSITAYFKLK